jgi:hypothetical protein
MNIFKKAAQGVRNIAGRLSGGRVGTRQIGFSGGGARSSRTSNS